MKIDKLLKLARTLRPTAFDDEILLMWANEIEGMVLNEIHLVAVADLTPYELGENGEVPTAELTAPYPYDKLYTQYLLAQIDYANGEYSKYQNTMEMFNACYTDYVHYVAEVLAPADGRATLLQYYLSAYAIAQKHGYTGTEEQWLQSLHGEAGKSVEMRYQDKIVQWMREGAAAWESLIDMQEIQDEITQDAQETIQGAATSAAATATAAATAAKNAAETAKAAAQTAENNAADSAADAAQSEQLASRYMDDAESAATTAAGAKSAAQSAAQTAQTAAGTAGSAAADAAQAKTDAETAKTAAQTAKQNAETAAQTAQAQKAAAQTAAQTAEAWSQGTRGGSAVGTSDETYHNNAKYWAQQAAASGGGGGAITKDAVIGALGYTPADENDIPTEDISANTAARHTHGNKAVLDGITGQVTAAKLNNPDNMTDLVQYEAFAAAAQQIMRRIPEWQDVDGQGGLTNGDVSGSLATQFLQSLTVQGLNFKYVNALHSGTSADPYGLKISSGQSLVEKINTMTEPGIYTVYQNRASTDAPDEAKANNSSLRGLVYLSQINKHYAVILMVDQSSNLYIQYVQGDVGGGWKRVYNYDAAAAEMLKFTEQTLTDAQKTQARTNLGLGTMATKSSVALASDVTGTLPLSKGGTGATTAAAARSALGLGSLATKSSASLSGSDVTGTLPLSKGGTGVTTIAALLTALGISDHITSSGTTDKTGITWQWIKFNSGLAICWGLTDSATVDVAWGWGNIFTSSPNGAGPYNLPFTFTSRCCAAEPYSQGGDYWLMTWKSGNGTTETPGYQLVRGTAKTSLTYRLSLFVIGMLAE